MTQFALDPCRCPLCGQANVCAMASPPAGAEASKPCWCTLVQFSGDLLKRVPEAARNKACICAACVSASEGTSHGIHQGEGA